MALAEVFGENEEAAKMYLDNLTMSEEICKIVFGMRDVYLWVLFAIGVPGNILTIITTLTMQAMSPATFFVVLLAFFDGMALLIKAIALLLINHDISLGIVGCKLEFIAVALPIIANWMLVLICAERFISVCYPLKKVSIFTKRRSYISAAVLVTFFLLFVAIIFIIITTIDETNECVFVPEHIVFAVKYWYWINAALYMFIPFLLILVLTIFIIRGLHISRRHRRSLVLKGSGRGGENESSARNNQRLVEETERVERAITIMMILAAVLFILFTLPTCVYYLSTDPYFQVFNCDASPSVARWNIFKQVQHIFADATHALNFFLYFLSAKRFRNQVWKVLKCKACKKERLQNRFQNTYSTQLSVSSRVNNSICPQSPIKL